MTILRPITSSEIALRNYVKDAARKANLNLSEINALNEKFGLNLKYEPKGDFIQLTNYISVKNDSFVKQCTQDALEMSFKTGLGIMDCMKHTSKNSLEMNLSSALKKLKQVLKK